MKYLRVITVILLGLIALMIGVLISSIIHNHESNNLWWAHILVVLGTLFITLTIHELNHAFMFSIQKIKIKAVYLFMLMFIRKNRHFIVKINPKLIILGGGLVVPLLPPVTNEEELEMLGQKISKSLIAAPIASIVFGFIVFVSFMLILFLSTNEILISLMISAVLTVLILTVLVIVASSAASDLASGDFIAYKRVKSDPDFLLSVISSYINFNPEAEELSHEFLFNKKINYLLSSPNNYNLISYSFIIDYLHEVVFENGQRNSSLDFKLLQLNKYSLSSSNEGITVLFLIVYLRYIIGDRDEALTLLEWLKTLNNKHISSKHLEYEVRRANQILNIGDELEFLTNPKNLYIGTNWIFAPLLSNEEDKTLYVKLKLGIKIPQIKFYQKI